MDDLATAVTQKAYTLGFNLVGFVHAQPARRLDAYLRWLEAGMHGRMAYLARPDRITRRQDLNIILPGVQTIICVGLDYATPPLPPAIAHDPSRGRISNYAWGSDYHEVMTPRLEELADWLKTQGKDTAVHSRVYVDTGAILERDHAESAGLGFTGKNTMLIHPRRGSFFFLGEILTTLEIRRLGDWEIDQSLNLPNRRLAISQSPISCGSCHRCLDACPTNAFPQPYVLDARRCISYLTIELKEWIPVELRPLLGNWIYGCDICQEVCPFNRFATPGGDWEIGGGDTARLRDWSPNLPISQSLNLLAPPLLDLLTLTEEGFNQRFAHSPIKRIKRARFLRNVCVAVGNWGSDTAPSAVDGSRPHSGQAVPALIPLLYDPHPLVRGHAAWALHQIGGPAAQMALAAALETETDKTVRLELVGNDQARENAV